MGSWLPILILIAGASDIFDAPSERVPLVTASPTYPEKAIEERIEGDVTVCFEVDAKGRIRWPHIRESSHRLFRRPAMKAIRRSSYEPAKDGQEPAAKSCRTYRFRLDRRESA